MDAGVAGLLVAFIEIGWPGAPPRVVRPGSVVTLEARGVANAASVRAWVGRQEARATLRPLRVTIPLQAPRECGVPLQIQVAGAPPSNTLAMPVSDGADCAPPENFPTLRVGDRMAAVLALRTRVRDLEGPGLVEYETVSAAAAVLDEDAARWRYPSEGACFSTRTEGEAAQRTFTSGLPAILAQLPGEGFSLGDPVAIASGTIRRVVAPVPGALGLYESTVGGRGLPLLLQGPRAWLGVAGARVPLPALPELIWTDRDSLREASRQAALPLRWRAPGAGSVLIAAGGLSADHRQAGFTLCRAGAAGGAFAVPARALAQLPAGGPGALLLAALPPNPCTALPAGGCVVLGRVEGAAVTWR